MIGKKPSEILCVKNSIPVAKLVFSYFDTMLNYGFSQKIKLLKYGKFNYLTTYF